MVLEGRRCSINVAIGTVRELMNLWTTGWLSILASLSSSRALSLQPRRMLLSMTATTAPRPRIAILGGGAAGLAAAQALRAYDRVVFEKDREIGGVWRHVPRSMSRPMYRGLRTNLPKEIMAFRALPFPDLDRSFVTHAQVLEYLHTYAKHFALMDCIRLGTTVDRLTVLDTPSRFCPDWPQIQIESSTASESSTSEVFDAVAICNGHYSLPVIPDLPGMEHFTGQTMHSIAYDDPRDFVGQTVLCVGGRASGSDIAREIAQVSGTHVYLSDSDFSGDAPVTEYNVTWVGKTMGFDKQGRVRFDQCETERPKVDTIIFCTGYDYHFPFLADSNLDMNIGQRRVAPLYEQLWHAQVPNVAFLGLPHSVVPFPLFELQAEACEQQWRTQGADWPEPEEMQRQAAQAAESGGEGKPNGRVPEDTHYLGDAQWDYLRRMGKLAHVYNDQLEDYIMTNKVGREIWGHVCDLDADECACC